MMIRTLLIALTFVLASEAAQAQLKIGYVYSDSLITLLPQYDSAKVKLKAETDKITQEIEFMYSELEKKQNEYLKIEKDPNVPASIKTLRLQTIQEGQQRINEFQQNAQQDIQTLEMELMRPLIDKIKKAIEEVAKEKGYTYVLDHSTGSILYSTPNDDLMPAVKKKLGLK